MFLKWIDDKPKFIIARKRAFLHTLLKNAQVKTAEGFFQQMSQVTRITVQRQLQRQLLRTQQFLKSVNHQEQQQHPKCNLKRHHPQPQDTVGKVTGDPAVDATPSSWEPKQRRVAHNKIPCRSNLRCNNSSNLPRSQAINSHNKSLKCSHRHSHNRSQHHSSPSLDAIFDFSRTMLHVRLPTRPHNPTLTQAATIGSPAWRVPSCRIFSARRTLLASKGDSSRIIGHLTLLRIRREGIRLTWAPSIGT